MTQWCSSNEEIYSGGLFGPIAFLLLEKFKSRKVYIQSYGENSTTLSNMFESKNGYIPEAVYAHPNLVRSKWFEQVLQNLQKNDA